MPRHTRARPHARNADAAAQDVGFLVGVCLGRDVGSWSPTRPVAYERTTRDRVWTRRVVEGGEWEEDDSMDSGKEPVDVDTVRRALPMVWLLGGTWVQFLAA